MVDDDSLLSGENTFTGVLKLILPELREVFSSDFSALIRERDRSRSILASSISEQDAIIDGMYAALIQGEEALENLHDSHPDKEELLGIQQQGWDIYASMVDRTRSNIDDNRQLGVEIPEYRSLS